MQVSASRAGIQAACIWPNCFIPREVGTTASNVRAPSTRLPACLLACLPLAHKEVLLAVWQLSEVTEGLASWAISYLTYSGLVQQQKEHFIVAAASVSMLADGPPFSMLTTGMMMQ